MMRRVLQAAVGQYEFLRTQYPGSSLRVQALLAEGQVEQIDLGDAAAAKEKYKLLLKQYPKSGQAEEARAALASLAQGSGLKQQSSEKIVARADSTFNSSAGAPASGTSASGGDGHARVQVAEPNLRDKTAKGAAPAGDGVAETHVSEARHGAPVSGGSSLPAMAQTSLPQTSAVQSSVTSSAPAAAHSAARSWGGEAGGCG